VQIWKTSKHNSRATFPSIALLLRMLVMVGLNKLL
jgi:hypothetical protein